MRGIPNRPPPARTNRNTSPRAALLAVCELRATDAGDSGCGGICSRRGRRGWGAWPGRPGSNAISTWVWFVLIVLLVISLSQGGQKTWKPIKNLEFDNLGKKTWKNLEFDNLGKKKLEKPGIWEILKKT